MKAKTTKGFSKLAKAGGAATLILLFLLYGAGFVALQFVCEFAPKPAPVVSSYSGLVINPCKNELQQKQASCGHSAIVYLLKLYGYSSSEKEVGRILQKDEWLSFKDMALFLNKQNLNWQALEVSFRYFKKNPAPGIMHVNWGHFIVFIDFDKRGDAIIFDPAQGLVLLKQETLKDIWNGYFLYVYN